MPDQPGQPSTRRTFLKNGSAAIAGASLFSAAVPHAHAAGNDVMKVALIGCGNRGAGAAVQALSVAPNVKLWSVADAFQDRIDSCLRYMHRGIKSKYDRNATASVGGQIAVPQERQFVGLDAYRHAIDSGVDVVLLVEPPGFRPKHFEYAVRAGKHVFMEKPVATDVAGVRRVLAAAEEAKKKELKVGVGLQRRHQATYLQAMEQLRQGAIGDVMALRCFWNTGWPAKTAVPRDQMTELEYQVRNWYFFGWLSGDHICEQHVHNLDVCNWVKGDHPVEAQGMGGRQVRTGKEYGNIFDHHSVEFTYADGTKMFSQCRQTPGCWSHVAEFAHGTKGTLELNTRPSITVGKETTWRGKAPEGDRGPYQAEHDALFKAIRENLPHAEAEYGATATMTGILGRMATYTGKIVGWDEAFESGQQLTTDAEDWNATPPVTANSDGRYAVAVPGETEIA
jgi:myo-inositol 2-dehydrogenase / D-chiro-inositol 1-dehydrogenase